MKRNKFRSDVVANCIITVIPRNPGDVDGDNCISLKDVTQMTRSLAGGWKIDIMEYNADVNNDCEINLKDVVLIRRYLAGGWDVELI